MENFIGAIADITLKIATHGSVPFMSWIQDYNVIYLDSTSGYLDHKQGSIWVTHHLIQDQ